jgi:hypothetical protein
MQKETSSIELHNVVVREFGNGVDIFSTTNQEREIQKHEFSITSNDISLKVLIRKMYLYQATVQKALKEALNQHSQTSGIVPTVNNLNLENAETGHTELCYNFVKVFLQTLVVGRKIKKQLSNI